ncbi:MAG: isopentenyl phosphate kinase [Roseiflexaceae bacterium]|nr:isopentenyl phosphate kinase [Roseiflexaceae bacterium]
MLALSVLSRLYGFEMLWAERNMIALVKLGGSIITDKTRQECANVDTIRRLAGELRQAIDAADMRIIVGHGSGSFGHIYAQRYGVHRGLAPDADWMGFALTSAAALRLNRIVVDELLAVGIPALALQPSATLVARGGQLARWNTDALERALDHRLVPVIHGDVAFDEIQGSAIISTEQLLAHLAMLPSFRPTRIVLVGKSGVYTADPRSNPHAERIARIDERNITDVLAGAGGSHGIDVTGGMRSKVELMWQLVQTIPSLQVYLIGPAPGLLHRALLGDATVEGTVMVAG